MSHNSRNVPQLPSAANNGNPAVPQAPILVNGEGQVVSGPLSGAGGSGSGTGGSGGGSTTTTTSSSSSPFVINVSWDSSVSSAPSGFTTAVMQAVQYLETQYSDPVTINISVGYGECAGYSLGSNTLGESMSYLYGYSYSQIYNALKADATTATDTSALASLTSTNPIAGANYWVSGANAKALGLLSATNSSTDGFIGFSSSLPFTYNNTNGVASGTYDFFGVAVHEITEVMGRMMFTGSTVGGLANSYTPYDLFHYSSAGVRDLSASTPGYFSYDGGKTNSGSFNTNSGGDAGDWSSAMGNDSFDAFSNSGVVNAVSSSDLAVMDTIGWNYTGGSTASATPTVTIKLASDTGASSTDNVTNNDSLMGTAAAGATVTLQEGTTVLGTTTADSNGNWTFTPTSLPQGAQTVTASETVSGTTASGSLTFTYDTIAPAVTIALQQMTGGTGSNTTSNDALSGTGDANATVQIFNGSTLLGTTTANSSGAWSYTPTSLAAGSYSLTASETDLAGNTGSASVSFTYSPPPPNIGVAISSAGYNSNTVNNAGLAGFAGVATITQTGGSSTDSYSYALGGTGASYFTLTGSGTSAKLAAIGTGVPGAVNGAVYNLNATVTDTTQNVSSAAAPLSVIVGSITAANVAVSGLIGANTPAFIYGGNGNDTLNGSGVAANLWFAGGMGADTMTAGSGTDVFQYASTSDSNTTYGVDTISGFSAASDLIDLTALGRLKVAGQVNGSNKLAAGSVGWQTVNGNTIVYVNTSTSWERIGSTNMQIQLTGSVPLTSANILHA